MKKEDKKQRILQKKYIKPSITKSKIDLNLFNMDFYGILSDEAQLLATCTDSSCG